MRDSKIGKTESMEMNAAAVDSAKFERFVFPYSKHPFARYQFKGQSVGRRG
jgi:hypothetical protein